MKSCFNEQMMIYTSIFTEMSTLSHDPVIAYFEVVWYEGLNNEYIYLSGLTIYSLQIDYARNVNFISVPCNNLSRVFLEAGTHLWPLKMPRIAIDAPHVIFLEISTLSTDIEISYLVVLMYSEPYFISKPDTERQNHCTR